ncbi:hypothetical protein SDRG_15602 [Saprolegnia diclina VS20]|uniref:Gram-positive cocci surface proteins LPxTG domain-containing protein n=1 Tax=Saprolegnia diclina (strain VS20) TaxID=1156394 RepID=T0RAK5_SAPDV|nr:hypothetical protein SDRG_15602 [Saprolegnia diclina VS20]EQC26572.1 hypothetical protein SDRG_15602 [Saprolegnia diclina VS20]|eukprot:XP_008620002.1 hypothetical protein SDRG_15602 [Saprolegnia diclina VS20]
MAMAHVVSLLVLVVAGSSAANLPNATEMATVVAATPAVAPTAEVLSSNAVALALTVAVAGAALLLVLLAQRKRRQAANAATSILVTKTPAHSIWIL